jgi:diguanylate cyclase (GGDEF)-like protein
LRHVDRPLAREVRRALVDTLFASPSSLAAGALVGGFVSAVIGYTSRDPVMSYLASLICLVGALRVASGAAYRDISVEKRRTADRGWERMYESGAWLFAALMGLMTYLTLTRNPDLRLHFLAAATTTGYAAGISARNAGRPAIAVGQVTLAALPLTAALVQGSDYIFWTAAIANVVFVLAMFGNTRDTYRVVLAAMSSAHDQSQLALRFERLAQIDSLTGLRNRFALKIALEKKLATDGGNQPGALLWIDLDRFKEVNDTLGHPVGDQLLRAVSARLQSVVREDDCLARFGGDEFVLLAGGIDKDTACTLAARILGLFAAPITVEGASLHITASIGIVSMPQPGCDAEALLKYADMALYHAKAAGRNAYREFEPGMQLQLVAMRETEESLRLAIDRHELELYYQPIVDLATMRVTCCEALIRWNHPTRGMVGPADFIPLAERTGLIPEITSWVLADACRAARSWPGDVRVAVNISPALLKRPDLLQSVMTALMASGLPAHRLELEITESVFMDEGEQSNTMLKALQKIGLRLALDDFGTGYSSLAYLHKYMFDKIKIDSSFIRAVGESRAAQAIINAVVSLARTLDVETVAEGVETAQQLAHVRELGCTGVQGYYLSMPVPEREIEALLERGAIEPAPPPVLKLASKGS